MRTLKYKEAIAEALVQAMEKDERVFIMGEGVTDSSGIFGTTLPACRKFPDRVTDMPLSEALITGGGTGAALAGMRPVMVHARNDFLYLAMDQIANHAAIWSYMHGGNIDIPWVIRVIVGRGWGNAAQHSQSLQVLFAHIPGLKVVMPASPCRAKGLLIAAIEDNSPVIFIEHRSLYDSEEITPKQYYSFPLGKGRLVKSGEDLTIIAISFMVVEAMKASLILKHNGISAEIIDVSSLKPLDKRLMLSSARKTGKVIILDTSWKSFGAGAEISAMISENIFSELKMPIVRIALPDRPVPSSPALEEAYYPSVSTIVNTACDLLDRKHISKQEIEKDICRFQGPF